MATTIKVSESTRDRVNHVGARTNQTADEVVQHAMAEYERSLFWAEYSSAADALAADDEALAAESHERRLWDLTSRDGLGRG